MTNSANAVLYRRLFAITAFSSMTGCAETATTPEEDTAAVQGSSAYSTAQIRVTTKTDVTAPVAVVWETVA